MTRRRVVWCLACGREASDPQPSLDPARPLVVCVAYAPDGHAIGHGLVPGTYDADELAEILTERRRDRATSRHPGRKGHNRPHPDCRICHPELELARA